MGGGGAIDRRNHVDREHFPRKVQVRNDDDALAAGFAQALSGVRDRELWRPLGLGWFHRYAAEPVLEHAAQRAQARAVVVPRARAPVDENDSEPSALAPNR